MFPLYLTSMTKYLNKEITEASYPSLNQRFKVFSRFTWTVTCYVTCFTINKEQAYPFKISLHALW